MKYGFTLLILFLFISRSFGQYVKGSIRDENGHPMPYANVYVKNSTYGASSNSNGKYFLALKPGGYTLVFSYIGYKTQEKKVTIQAGKHEEIDITMPATSSVLEEVTIVAGKKDRAREIIDHVREKRKYYLSQIENYECRTYVITSLEKEPVHQPDSLTRTALDTLDIDELKDIREMYKKQKLNLIESLSTSYYQSPSKYKEIIDGHHDYIEKRPDFNKNLSLSISYGEDDLIPEPQMSDNPYIIYHSLSDGDFNFYKNLIDIPALCQQPLLSPVANSAPLSYKFELSGSFYEQGKLIYKINVIPLFKSEALFYGTLFIEDSSWVIRSVDLSINPAALSFFNDFHIIQNYEEIKTDQYLPVRREFNYTIRDGKNNILGNTRISHTHYQVNIPFPDNFFNNEIIKYRDDALEKDSTYWNDTRPIVLKENEVNFIRKTDSIADYFVSDEYYRKLDSSFNRVTWWLPLSGYGHRNRKAGTEFYIEGLLSQINPFGIGGYRHKLPGYFNYTFKNNMKLESNGFVDYGFRNQDVKGKLGIGFTYIPLKFVRTYIEVGNFYEMINNYASLERLLSRSNYVKTQSLRISQKMELINGLFGELTLDYSDQDPITDLQLAPWSKWLFGKTNEPTDFKRYVKTEIELRLRYRINQKYIIKQGKKIIYGTDYPEFSFTYRKGIPNLFNSEVDFDYLEIGAGNETQLGRAGSSLWHVNAGKFLNTTHLRMLEYKFFRGSDRYFFSDPLLSFQLFESDSIVYSNNAFLRANYIHHFEGTVLGKVPLLNKLKLQLAAGGGLLSITNAGVTKSHVEVFTGLERLVRIKKQLFRFGVYGVGRDNVFDSGNLTFKFGIDFFNTYTNKWNY